MNVVRTEAAELFRELFLKRSYCEKRNKRTRLAQGSVKGGLFLGGRVQWVGLLFEKKPEGEKVDGAGELGLTCRCEPSRVRGEGTRLSY